MTQTNTVLDHMLTGRSISPLEALGLYGMFRLAARVYELKAMGWDIVTDIKTDINGKRYAEYRINDQVDA